MWKFQQYFLDNYTNLIKLTLALDGDDKTLNTENLNIYNNLISKYNELFESKSSTTDIHLDRFKKDIKKFLWRLLTSEQQIKADIHHLTIEDIDIDPTISKKIVGIHNVGNTCWLNSCIQMIRCYYYHSGNNSDAYSKIFNYPAIYLSSDDTYIIINTTLIPDLNKYYRNIASTEYTGPIVFYPTGEMNTAELCFNHLVQGFKNKLKLEDIQQANDTDRLGYYSSDISFKDPNNDFNKNLDEHTSKYIYITCPTGDIDATKKINFNNNLLDNTKTGDKYELISIICRLPGHYINISKYDNNWYYFSDIQIFNFKDDFKRNFFTEYNKSESRAITLLLYKKKDDQLCINTSIPQLKLCQFGVLGFNKNKEIDVTSLLDFSQIIVVDPAGLNIGEPGKTFEAGEASGAIYEWVKEVDTSRNTFPSDVQNHISDTGDAVYYEYALNRHIIHVVGPCANRKYNNYYNPEYEQETIFTNILTNAYTNVLDAFINIANYKSFTLHLLPISGGAFAGPHDTRISIITVDILTKLLNNDKYKDKDINIRFCMFTKEEYEAFHSTFVSL